MPKDHIKGMSARRLAGITLDRRILVVDGRRRSVEDKQHDLAKMDPHDRAKLIRMPEVSIQRRDDL